MVCPAMSFGDEICASSQNYTAFRCKRKRAGGGFPPDARHAPAVHSVSAVAGPLGGLAQRRAHQVLRRGGHTGLARCRVRVTASETGPS
jgi:hypothetical protein